MTSGSRTGWYSALFGSILAAVILLGFASMNSHAQVGLQEIAPPPLKILSKDELAQLGAITDVKKRTSTALELMSLRLTQAETLIEREDLDQMYKELGSFHGLMDNTLAFLNGNAKNSNRVLNNFKRYEMGLRQFRPRLEMIRRSVPLMYEPYVNNLIGYLRDARAKAVEPLFGDSVVPRTRP